MLSDIVNQADYIYESHVISFSGGDRLDFEAQGGDHLDFDSPKIAKNDYTPRLDSPMTRNATLI